MPARTQQQQQQRAKKGKAVVKTATAAATYRYRKEGSRAAYELYKRDRHYVKRIANEARSLPVGQGQRGHGVKSAAKIVRSDATKAVTKKVRNVKAGAAAKASTAALSAGQTKYAAKQTARRAGRTASKAAYVAKTHPKTTAAVGLGVIAAAYVGHKAYEKRQHKYSSMRKR